MLTIFIVCIIIVMIVLLLSILTTSKAYSYKHTIDPIENNPHIEQIQKNGNSNKENSQDEKSKF